MVGEGKGGREGGGGGGGGGEVGGGGVGRGEGGEGGEGGGGRGGEGGEARCMHTDTVRGSNAEAMQQLGPGERGTYKHLPCFWVPLDENVSRFQISMHHIVISQHTHALGWREGHHPVSLHPNPIPPYSPSW